MLSGRGIYSGGIAISAPLATVVDTTARDAIEAGDLADVAGPAIATDNAIARFDGTDGKLIQSSVVTIADTTGNVAGVGTINTHTLPGGTDTFMLLDAIQVAKNKRVRTDSCVFANADTAGKRIKLVPAAGQPDDTEITLTAPDGSGTIGTSAEIDSDVSAHAALTTTHGVTGALVGTTDTQTLTGKTLTGNTAANFVNGAGTITLPSTTSTLATLGLAETLSGPKTLATPTISGNVLYSSTSNASILTNSSTAYQITDATTGDVYAAFDTRTGTNSVYPSISMGEFGKTSFQGNVWWKRSLPTVGNAYTNFYIAKVSSSCFLELTVLLDDAVGQPSTVITLSKTYGGIPVIHNINGYLSSDAGSYLTWRAIPLWYRLVTDPDHTHFGIRVWDEDVSNTQQLRVRYQGALSSDFVPSYSPYPGNADPAQWTLNVNGSANDQWNTVEKAVFVADSRSKRVGINLDNSVYAVPNEDFDVQGNLRLSGTIKSATANLTLPGVTGTIATSAEVDSDVAAHAALTTTHGVTGALVGTTDTQTLTGKTLTGNIAANFSNSGTVTLPTGNVTLATSAEVDSDVATHAALTTTHGVTGALVGTTDTQTLTGKTLTGNIAANFSNSGTVTLPTGNVTLATSAEVDSDVATHAALTTTHGVTGALVGTTDTQTLTGKTLTGNIAANFVNGAGTITLPSSTSTLATLGLAETLSGPKTLTTPTISGNVLYSSATLNSVPTNTSGALATWDPTTTKYYEFIDTRTASATLYPKIAFGSTGFSKVEIEQTSVWSTSISVPTVNGYNNVYIGKFYSQCIFDLCVFGEANIGYATTCLRIMKVYNGACKVLRMEGNFSSDAGSYTNQRIIPLTYRPTSDLDNWHLGLRVWNEGSSTTMYLTIQMVQGGTGAPVFLPSATNPDAGFTITDDGTEADDVWNATRNTLLMLNRNHTQGISRVGVGMNKDYLQPLDMFDIQGNLRVSGTFGPTANLTLPTGTLTLATLTGTEILTGKTLTGNTAANFVNGGTITLPTATGTLATLAGTETLTGKTLTGNIAANFSNSGTVTLPTGNVTLATTAQLGSYATLTGAETLSAKTIRLANGTVGAPSLAFDNDTNSGWYFISDNVIGYSVNGGETVRLDSNGLLGTPSPAGLGRPGRYIAGASGTFTLPSGVTKFQVFMAGGGGGGAGGKLGGGHGGSGGGSACCIIGWIGYNQGQTFNWTRGAGGTGGARSANGGNGGQSELYFSGGASVHKETKIYAYGGGGGISSTDNTSKAGGGGGGTGGNASGSTGGTGSASNPVYTSASDGGGPAGSAAAAGVTGVSVQYAVAGSSGGGVEASVGVAYDGFEGGHCTLSDMKGGNKGLINGTDSGGGGGGASFFFKGGNGGGVSGPVAGVDGSGGGGGRGDVAGANGGDGLLIIVYQ